MNYLMPTVKVLLMMFTLIVLFIYVFQRHLMYHPLQSKPTLVEFSATDMSEVYLKTSDGLALNAWYKPAAAHKPTILFMHGNAGNIGYRMPLVRQFLDEGYGFLLFDYRGYGGNEGSPTEQGLYTDAVAAVDYLDQHGVNSTQLVLYGESIGTGVASYLANRHQSCALILQSPFTTFTAVAHAHYPWLPLSPWDKFDSLSRIKTIKTPLLVLHGTTDNIVPYQQGLELFNAALEPKKMISFADYGHNDLWSAPDFYEQVNGFIQKHCKQINYI